MKLGYRYARVILLLILAIAALNIHENLKLLSLLFGVILLVSAFLTLIYIFINFDKNLNEKVFMEMFTDAFSGLIIFTYPNSNETFFIITFSFWVAIMGIMMLLAGLFDSDNREYLWFYILLGLVLIVTGFVAMHTTSENTGILKYLISFMLIIYTLSNFRLLHKRKQDTY
jgi:uncharacterized membrane protein HdeD (DUF308 family)